MNFGVLMLMENQNADSPSSKGSGLFDGKFWLFIVVMVAVIVVVGILVS
jgi:hypothetical protein